MYDIFSLPCIFIRIRPAYTFFSSNVARDKIEFDTPDIDSVLKKKQTIKQSFCDSVDTNENHIEEYVNVTLKGFSLAIHQMKE